MYYGSTNNKISVSNNNFIDIGKKTSVLQKIWLIFAFLFFFTNCCSISNIAHAENLQNQTNVEEDLFVEIDNILNNQDFSELDNIVDELGFDFDGSILEYISKVVSGENVISFDDILKIIKNQFFELLHDVLSPLMLILVIILLSSLLSALRPSRMSNSINDVIYFLCLSVIVVIISLLVKNVLTVSRGAILSLQKQINIVYPIIMSLLVTLGASGTIATFSPAILFFSNTIMNIFINVLFPIFTFVVLICLVSKVTRNNRLDKMSGFLNSSFKWILGSVCAIFMSLLSVQGMTAGVKDGLSIKAAKFVIKNYIPFLGGYISEGFELVKAGSLLVKNALGIVSIIILFFTVIKPIIYLCVLSLSLRLFCAATGVVDNLKVGNLLVDIANALKMLVAIIIGVACMYFFILFIIISVGNSLV